MSEIPKPGPGRPDRRRRWVGVAARLLIAGFAIMSVGDALSAQPISPREEPALTRCTSVLSLEKRLVMEQWARPGGCERPVRTRVLDQFLGFTCLSEAGFDACRSFVPGAESRAFDTAQVFRCVDLALTEVDGGIAILRVREWAAAPKQCDWD